MVSQFIRQQTGTTFEAVWMLVAEWDNVAEYGSNTDRVSSSNLLCGSLYMHTSKITDLLLYSVSVSFAIIPVPEFGRYFAITSLSSTLLLRSACIGQSYYL